MKRPILIFLFFAFACMLSGCGNIEFNIEDTIKPPAKDTPVIEGTWKVERIIPVKKNTGQETNIGTIAIFDHEISAIGREACVHPEYRIIRTTADTFVQSRYRIEEELLGLRDEPIDVITITAENQLFYEIIVEDKTTAYVYKENGFLVLRKISDSVDPREKEISYGNAGLNVDSGEYQEDPLLRSGVLIGVRSSDNTYRTLWIYSKNREVKNVSTRQQLMIPRSKGFWELGVEKDTDSGEKIFARPFDELFSSPVFPENNRQNSLDEKADAQILFAGNDYIGIEHDLRYGVFSMDELSQKNELPLSEFINDGNNIIQKSAQTFVASLEDEKAKQLITKPSEDNFTLKRRNGHWIMKSRLYYKGPSDQSDFVDFDLNIVVPSKLIHYDEMEIPWNEIKSRIPWITDAFMSPNKDIAILLSEGSLNIYPVQNRSIVNKQLMKIPLSKGDSVVMTEWAIGRYADIWESFAGKSFSVLK